VLPAKKAQGKPASSPADFPKVDDSTQKARDSDRKQILQDELKAEQKKLDDLKKTTTMASPSVWEVSVTSRNTRSGPVE